MLVNLIPEFLSTLSAADRSAAYHEYLDRHRPILGAYWQNYVLDPESPHAEPIIENALRADRSDLKRLLEDVDVVAIAEDALRGSTRGSTSATIAASIGGCASSTSSCGAPRRMTSTAPGSDSGSAISRAGRARLHDWWPAKCFPSARAITSAGGW